MARLDFLLARRWARLVVLCAAALGLAGCAAPGVPSRDAGTGLVFGHITVPQRLTHVYLYEMGRAYIGTLNMPRATVYRNGDFAFANLQPGDYYLAGFTDRTRTYWVNYTKGSLQRALIHVGKDQVLFAGAFQITDVDSKRFGNGSFDIRRVTRPTASDILQRLQARVGDSGWGPLIEASLKSRR
ncbi:MAG TPA: hypothetical protein VKA50_09390 [Gammaproteobacteria bacterium]|nr:hypothetical protein [Gammaproteobacteria bacterium]